MKITCTQSEKDTLKKVLSDLAFPCVLLHNKFPDCPFTFDEGGCNRCLEEHIEWEITNGN